VMLEPNNEARLVLHTHFVRSGYVMLEPNNEARLVLHTHFVRSGYVMLEPKWPETVLCARCWLEHQQHTSHEVGMCKNARRLGTSDLVLVGSSITGPRLTRWVCAKSRASVSILTLVRCANKI